MSDVSSEDFAKYKAISEQSVHRTIDQLQKAAKGNQHLMSADAASSSYTIGAQASFAQAFIYGTLDISNASYEGYNIGFNGTMWGPGLGGGTSYGALTLTVPPSQLNGLKCSFQATFAGAAAGGVTVQIWDDNHGYVANFSGPALAVAAGITGGSGTWSSKN